MPLLLAVDLGLKTGLALYGDDGRLRWYRSQHFGTAGQLRRAVRSLLVDLPDLAWVVLEGGGPLAAVWEHEADRRSISTRRISAEDWRQRFLYPREQSDRPRAKKNADEIARRVIEWSDASRPTSLRHDAAEAILIGLWGVLEVGWLAGIPGDVRR